MMAKEAGSDSYVRMNNASIAEWNKMLSGTEGKAQMGGAKM